MAAATTVKTVFGSGVPLVDFVHETTEKLAALAGCDEEESLNAAIAVREAVINAVAHGNKKDPARRVEVHFKVRPGKVEVRVRDEGEGFDPASTPDPTAGDNRLKTTGRGLLLIRAFVDDVAFRYREGRGMELALVKRHRGRKPAALTHAASA